jgi:predicted metalloprotease with PDZ domain
MLARTLGGFAISLAFAGALSAQSPDAVHYSVAPVMEGGALTGLAVELRFAGDADGETLVQLPDEWAGADSLWRHLGDVRVDGAGSTRPEGPNGHRIAHAPGAPLTVRYRVSSAYDGEPGFGFQKARPLILPGWFFFHGEGVFAVPEGRDDSPATFAWRDVPAGWTIASDLDYLARERAGTVTDISESASIGAPDLVVIERQVGGAPLRLATRGSWSFQPAELADAVAAIVDAENRFWGEPGRPFLVPLAPLGGSSSGYSFGGTGRTDAFSIVATPGFGLALASHFLAHEYMHTWNARELGGHRSSDEGMGYWFTEGWTDFYAARILLRAGLWTPADYAAELNTVLMRYAASPARTAPNAELAERFWSDQAFEKMPYDRGHLLALRLNGRIRRETAGRADMDDVMQAQRAMARAQAGQPGRMDAATLFPAIARDRFAVDVSDEIARHVDRGEPILLPADLFGACASIQTLSQPDFHRGFDLAATEAAGGVIAGTDAASPAYAAGLRDGMRIIRREAGTPGDPTIEYAYRVDDGGTERVIRYLPAGRGTVTFQRVTLGPDASSAACVALMSGA